MMDNPQLAKMISNGSDEKTEAQWRYPFVALCLNLRLGFVVSEPFELHGITLLQAFDPVLSYSIITAGLISIMARSEVISDTSEDAKMD